MKRRIGRHAGSSGLAVLLFEHFVRHFIHSPQGALGHTYSSNNSTCPDENARLHSLCLRRGVEPCPDRCGLSIRGPVAPYAAPNYSQSRCDSNAPQARGPKRTNRV